MNETIISVAIGGLIALIPGLLATVVDLIKHKRQQRHDIDLRRFDTYSRTRFEAIEAYAQALTRYVSKDYDRAFDSWHEYLRTYERVSLFVSDDTRDLMLGAFGTLIPVEYGIDVKHNEPRRALISIEFNAIISAMHRELFSELHEREAPQRRQNASNRNLQTTPNKAPKIASIKRFVPFANPFRKGKRNQETEKPK